MRKIEPHQKCSSSAPLDDAAHARRRPRRSRPRSRSPAAARWAGTRGPGSTASPASRTRHRRPSPRARRSPRADELDNAANNDAAPNTIEPAVEREPSSVAVTERAGGQQQPGEHEAVGVDDPLQRARRRRARSSARVGSATLRLALAITIITRLMHSTPSVHQRRSYSRSLAACSRSSSCWNSSPGGWIRGCLVRCSSNVSNTAGGRMFPEPGKFHRGFLRIDDRVVANSTSADASV